MRLHPKHGLSPTLGVCFWCGDSTGEIALLGAAYKGEAPMKMVIDLEPCATCKAEADKGCALYEVTSKPGNDMLKVFEQEAWFTGRWVVVKDEAVTRIFDKDMADAVLKARKAVIDQEAFAMLFPPTE